MRRIGIIDADLLDHGTRHPNLALMKISGFQKSLGNEVTLIEDYNSIRPLDFDDIYVSKVFTFSKFDSTILSWPNVHYGGTGFYPDGGPDLDPEIEHWKPDYNLYVPFIDHQIKSGHRNRIYYADYLDYSIGFTTRGCIRKCSFCVNKKYNRVNFHSHISEWMDPERKYIYLWDDNILAYSDWRKVFDELAVAGKAFQFRQGMDIRLMTAEKAKVIAESHYRGDFIFAFDHIDEKEKIMEKLALWRQYCGRSTKLYVLCGYDSQDEKDVSNTFERIAVLFEYGCLPYIMRYESYKESPHRGIYIQLARWCNQPQFVKKKSFREFCEANQYYHQNSNTLCAAYSAMLEFEKQFPDIAKKYFDIRFDQTEYYRMRMAKDGK